MHEGERVECVGVLVDIEYFGIADDVHVRIDADTH